MSTEEPMVLFKLLTIGDSGVGKSWLLIKWKDPKVKFSKSNQAMPTIGVDFQIRYLEINGQKVKVQIWDTAGQERYRTMTQGYYRQCKGVLLVYDITHRGSFDNIKNWMQQISLHAGNDVSKILIGNKCDMSSERQVSYEDGEYLAREFKIPFIETSALNNINVEEAVSILAGDVIDRMNQKKVCKKKRIYFNL